MTTTLAQSSIDNFVVSQAGTINDLASELATYYQNMGHGIIIDDVIQAIILSFRFYAAWAITNGQMSAPQPITRNTVIALHEWGLISKLVTAHIEYIQASRMEATKSLGTESYGLSSSEAKQNVNFEEEELKKNAFIEPPFTVDYDYATPINMIKRL